MHTLKVMLAYIVAAGDWIEKTVTYAVCRRHLVQETERYLFTVVHAEKVLVQEAEAYLYAVAITQP